MKGTAPGKAKIEYSVFYVRLTRVGIAQRVLREANSGLPAKKL